MATGTGKTLLAVTEIYRLIKFGGARRVLFLVDRANLGEQAEKEFQGFRTPDDNRKFTELYNVQRLTSNTIGSSSKVVISTIQRLYSILKGEPELDPEAEEHTPMDSTTRRCPRSRCRSSTTRPSRPSSSTSSSSTSATAPSTRCGGRCWSISMPTCWASRRLQRSTPMASSTRTSSWSTRTSRRLRTASTATTRSTGFARASRRRAPPSRLRPARWLATATAKPARCGGRRRTRTCSTPAADLDRNVVATDQIRLIVQTFRDKVLKETFPDRTEAVPKTLIFAKDDSHAEDIVKIVREEFGKGNDFCQKITYKVTGAKPADLIQSFRNSYNPRIVVTVDLIATGTDIKPVEIVMFMRSVHSRVLFEQMKGRGVRVINPDELRAVTPDAQGQDALPHRGLRGRDGEDAVRHQAAGQEPQRLAQGAARSRRRGRREGRLPVVARQPTGPDRQAVRSRRQEAHRRRVRRRVAGEHLRCARRRARRRIGRTTRHARCSTCSDADTPTG